MKRSWMRWGGIIPAACIVGGLLTISWLVAPANAQSQPNALQVRVDPADGSYIIGTSGVNESVLRAGIAVELDGHWLQSKDYPKHTVANSRVSDDLGEADESTVTFSGLAGQPDLVYRIRTYPDKPVADIQVFVRNTTTKALEVEAIRPLAALGNSILNLGGPVAEDRVLSDSFSEDRPNITIHDLGDGENP